MMVDSLEARLRVDLSFQTRGVGQRLRDPYPGREMCHGTGLWNIFQVSVAALLQAFLLAHLEDVGRMGRTHGWERSPSLLMPQAAGCTKVDSRRWAGMESRRSLASFTAAQIPIPAADTTGVSSRVESHKHLAFVQSHRDRPSNGPEGRRAIRLDDVRTRNRQMGGRTLTYCEGCA